MQLEPTDNGVDAMIPACEVVVALWLLVFTVLVAPVGVAFTLLA